ncbi:NlpC/P60 family protein [Eubacteriales bacterium OttesenSCG-928-M02]|nr:NlpC/P60 family protein [Eubacteriales bacterium OttesenSCG-928-M02]
MSKGIKTREVKKDIRVLDKAGTVAGKVKAAYVRTKDEAMQTQQDGWGHSSPSEYAEDQVVHAADRTAHETAHQVKKQGGRAFEKVKDIRRSAKESSNRTDKATAKTPLDIPKERMKKRAQENVNRSGSRARQSVDKNIKQTIRSSEKAVKSTGKGTVKTAKKSIKTAEKTARTTIKTTKHATKATQKTAQAAAKAAQKAAQATRATAKAAATAAKAAVKATIAFVKMSVAAIKSLIAAIAAGGWVAIVIILVICLIGLLLGSVFGIFFSNESSDNTMTEVVTELNAEFSGRIEQIQNDNPHDHVVLHNSGNSTMAGNWRDVLAIYAVKTAGDTENGMEVATLDDTKVAILREIFWNMNDISYTITETTTRPDGITDDAASDSESGEDDETPEETRTYRVLTITVHSKSHREMVDAYSFTDDQRKMLDELLQPQYAQLFMQLTGSYVNINLSPEEIAAIMENLNSNLSDQRKSAVLNAYSIVDKVRYFWGGKSTVIGWDSRWGTPTKVSSAGSPTTGTVRPFGLDCSGYVTWIFVNVAGEGNQTVAVNSIRHGARNQYGNCYKIGWNDVQPGDLAFFKDLSHVGIVIGKMPNGNILIAHCSSSRNNVVVDEYSGLKSGGFYLFGTPKFYDGSF